MPASAQHPDRLWWWRWRRLPILASKVRIRVAHLTHRHASVRIDPTAYAGPGFRLEIPGAGTFEVGAGVLFRRGFYCEIGGGGSVRIGAGTVFAANNSIQCTTTVEIGERCLFGTSTVIADGAHRFRDWTKPVSQQGYDFRPIVIGSDAVIHGHVTIVASIGDRSVVAANSLVNRDVPDYTLVGGVPARVLEHFGPPRDDAADG